MSDRCTITWRCRPCGERHACALDPLHPGPCRTRRERELDVCQWDGKVALRFPDPAKDDGDAIFRPRAVGGRHA